MVYLELCGTSASLTPDVCSGSLRNIFLGSDGGESITVPQSGRAGYLPDGFSNFGQDMCDHYPPLDLMLFMHGSQAVHCVKSDKRRDEKKGVDPEQAGDRDANGRAHVRR
jgi:hypothetical protein